MWINIYIGKLENSLLLVKKLVIAFLSVLYILRHNIKKFVIKIECIIVKNV